MKAFQTIIIICNIIAILSLNCTASEDVTESNNSEKSYHLTLKQSNVVINYNLPEATFRGQELIDFHQSTEKQYQDPSASEMLEERKKIEKWRIREFDEVSYAIDRAYNQLDELKKQVFASDYEAANRDIEKLREFALYGCTFPVDGSVLRAIGESNVDDNQVYICTIIISNPQIENWKNNMMSWGVYYRCEKNQAWPDDTIAQPPMLISEGGVKITGGDWRGAWLLNNGIVYVPGLQYFLKTEITIEKQDQK
jgi:hypothetical protein